MTSSQARRVPPRRRLLMLAALLVLSLGLGAALAVQSIQTARRHRQTAERALQDYADFAAFILASRTYRLLGAAVVESFAAIPPGRGPDAATRTPTGTVCAGGVTWIERDLAGGALRLGGAPLPEAGAAFVADTLRDVMRLLNEAAWRFRFIRLPPSAGADGIFLVAQRNAAGANVVRAFTACLGGPESPVRHVMLAEHALPPAITGDQPPDSLYSVSMTGARADSGAQPLFQSPLAWESNYRGTALLGTEFGDLALSVALRPGITSRLVIGGIPRSPTPLAIGLLALSTLLVVTALLQLRREYELIAIRSDFISSVSHELRTPLSQILIFTELLNLGRLRTPAERQRALDVIDQEARRLIRLVENVLQFSRSTLGRRRLDRETLPLAEVVGEVLDAFRPLAAAREVTLRADVPAAAAVAGDRSALRQILLNLLDNAVKYGPRGQTVRVEAAQHNGRTVLAVEDQGPGVPAEDRERAWEGFYRLDRERRSAVAGSGIGLSVVRSLAGDMGGRTWIEGAPGGGARVVVELQSGGADG